MPRFHVTVFTPRNLCYFSSILGGLYELERDGMVRVETKLALEMAADGAAVRCRVRDRHTLNEADVLFDLADGEALMPAAARGPADVVFKRSLGPASRASADTGVGLHPTGLVLGARAGLEPSAWRFYLASQLAVVSELDRRRWPQLRRELLGPAYRELQHARTYARRQRFSDWEACREGPHEPFALFQTRVLSLHYRFQSSALATLLAGLAQAKAEVNDQRARLVRRLRQALGADFRGGIAPEAHALGPYADCLTTLSTGRDAYRELVRRARVVVYSRGLLGSAAFKLGEYLAAGKCIVADRVTAELPSPLRDGEHLVYFDDDEQCVAACRALLDDPERARALGRNAARYYDDWVRPRVNALRMLEIAGRSGKPRPAHGA